MLVLREWCRVSGGTVLAALLQATPECFELYDDVILLKDGVVVYHGPRVEVAQYFEQHFGLVQPDDVDLADFIIEVLTNPQAQFKKQARAFAQGKRKRKFPLTPELPQGFKAPEKQLTNGNGHAAVNGNGHDAAGGRYASNGNGKAAVLSPAGSEKEVSAVRFHMATGMDIEDSVNRPEGQQALSPAEAQYALAAPVGDDDHIPLKARLQSEWPISTEAMLREYKQSPYYFLQRQAVDRVQSERAEKVAAITSDAAKARSTPYTSVTHSHPAVQIPADCCLRSLPAACFCSFLFAFPFLLSSSTSASKKKFQSAAIRPSVHAWFRRAHSSLSVSPIHSPAPRQADGASPRFLSDHSSIDFRIAFLPPHSIEFLPQNWYSTILTHVLCHGSTNTLHTHCTHTEHACNEEGRKAREE